MHFSKRITSLIITVVMSISYGSTVFAGQYDIDASNSKELTVISKSAAQSAEEKIVVSYYTSTPVADSQFVALAANEASSGRKITYTNAPQLS